MTSKVQKISPRHQSERLVPCRMCGEDDEGESLVLLCSNGKFVIIIICIDFIEK
ncbi:MAG: hypothetical protein GX213_04375 [Clostridiaceae bacterium]|nr:hypothetical protein [Clostridiaceae bacterium]